MNDTISVNLSVRLTIVTTITLLGLIVYRRYRVRQWGLCKSKKSLKGQVVIVTGANSGLGKATAFELARRGARVILACRDVEKGRNTADEILKAIPSCNPGDLIVLHLDLASFDSIHRFATEFRQTKNALHILINNAGVMACNYELTVDDIETHMSVNHYGPLLLTNLLMNDLKKCSPSRIIFVTSMLAQKGSISLEPCDKTLFNKREAYANSKLANFIYAVELHNRLGTGNGVDVYLVSPGHVWTNLGRYLKPSWWKILMMWPVLLPLAYLFVRTPFQGCQTVLHTALEDELEPGGLYRNCRKSPYPANIAKHLPMAKSLWDHSFEVTKQNYFEL